MPRRKAGDPPAAQPAANSERGESELILEGATYRLRPSYAAIVAIEKATDMKLIALVNEGNRGNISLDNLGIIARELIRAGAEDDATRHVGAERLSELIYEAGVISATMALTACLVEAVTGGRTAEGERKAIAE
jgi:hypothetical protein